MQNQQLAARPQVALQESVQQVIKVQCPCGCAAVFAIFVNVKIYGEISGDAGKRTAALSSWPLALSVFVVTIRNFISP